MPRARITKETAERILQGFREAPGNCNYAANVGGVNYKTALKYWKDGWQAGGVEELRQPFQMIVEREQVEARARMELDGEEARKRALQMEVERQATARERASQDATDSRVQEAAVVRAARQNAAALLGATTQLVAGLIPLGKKARGALEKLAEDPSQEMTLHQAVDVTRLLNRLATTIRQANDAAQKAMEMERLLLGEPGKIVGHVHAQLEPVTVVEAKERLAAVKRSIETLEAEGINIMDGRPYDPALQ